MSHSMLLPPSVGSRSRSRSRDRSPHDVDELPESVEESEDSDGDSDQWPGLPEDEGEFDEDVDVHPPGSPEDDMLGIDPAVLPHLVEVDCLVEVPAPAVAPTLRVQQDVAEYYSPPRVLPAVRAFGLSGSLSLDILSQWDLRSERLQAVSLNLLNQLQIYFLMLSPPCTVFSSLQRLWNMKHWTPDQWQARWQQGMIHLRHSMNCAAEQHVKGRLFVFEHPAGATSWKTSEVQYVSGLDGVVSVTFDQCMLGLKSKVHGVPMRKRTRLLTNSTEVARRFSGHMCDKMHDHQRIQGIEGGLRRSQWAQCYPEPMVALLAAAAAAEVRSRSRRSR